MVAAPPIATTAAAATIGRLRAQSIQVSHARLLQSRVHIPIYSLPAPFSMAARAEIDPS